MVPLPVTDVTQANSLVQAGPVVGYSPRGWTAVRPLGKTVESRCQ